MIEVATATAVATACSIVLFFYLPRLLRIGRRASDLPPGPPTIPLLGNLHLVSSLLISLNCASHLMLLDAYGKAARAISEMGSGIRVWHD